MFEHFTQAVYMGFSVLSRNDEARSPRLTMEVMKQGTGGELRAEWWRGTGDKGKEAHRLMKRVSFVRRAFDDKEYFSCGFIFVAFYRRFNEQKGEFVRQHFFSTFPSCTDFHANQRTSVGWLIRDDTTCKKMNGKLYGNWRMLLVFLESSRFFREIFCNVARAFLPLLWKKLL